VCVPRGAASVALSVVQYDRLEHAITKGMRLVIMRRGSEYLVIPERLRVISGREVIIARHPSTGRRLDLYIDDVDSIEVV
jgi:uncharacterized protein with PhoU and TrkA domain